MHRSLYPLTAASLALGLLAGAPSAHAQSAILNLPRVSQHALVSQRVGITDITIDYHRPLVDGRQVFGGLQAWGQVWRAGANENTVIRFGGPVTVDGHELPAGAYGLHMIPGKTSWIVIFSKNSTSWGSFTYTEAEDALRVTVEPRASPHQEALTYEFDQPTPTSAIVTLRWAEIAVPFTINVDTPAIVERSLRDQLRARAQFEWQPWMEAADYLLANGRSAEEAANDAKQSIAVEDRFENEITLSRALTKLGRADEARAARTRALGMASQAQVHTFARTLQGQGLKSEALDLFRENIKKDPASWTAHNEAARLAAAAGDFATAVKEMKLALQLSPQPLRDQHADLVRRLEKRDDINR